MDYLYYIIYEDEACEDRYFRSEKEARKYLKMFGYFHERPDYGGSVYYDDCNNQARIGMVYTPSYVMWRYKNKIYQGEFD